MNPVAPPEHRKGVGGWLLFIARILVLIHLVPLALGTLALFFQYLYFASFGGERSERADPFGLWMAHYLAVPTTLVASTFYGLLHPARGEPIRFARWGTARPVIYFAIGATAFWLFLALGYLW